jgi:hypothetical protein
LRVALANADGYRNGNAYCNGDAYRYTETYTYTTDCADAETTSHAAASPLRPAFNARCFGDSRLFASPRNAYGP